MRISTKYHPLSLLVLCLGCASYNPPAVGNQSTEEGKYYTSVHPVRDISDQLEGIQRSVKRISATAIYQTYYFDDRRITLDKIKSMDVNDLAGDPFTRNQSTAGTAFAIAGNSRSIVLLTCAHVVDFPDTLVSYMQDENIPDNTFVKSVTIRRSQTNLLYDLPNIGTFEILAQNDPDDLALIEVNPDDFEDLQAPSLSIEMGNPERLRLGSYVMIMGYPNGFPMVTRGIVSDPNRSEAGDFLMDALFNQGISGGLILATRTNYASFEWIGMANTASATREMELIPDPLKVDLYESFDPYSDRVYVQEKVHIAYGITQAIPAKTIVDFLREHESELSRHGFSVGLLISADF